MGWCWDCVVFLFPDTFRIKWILSFPLFRDTSTELSAADARRGVSNCIQTNCIQVHIEQLREKSEGSDFSLNCSMCTF